MQADVLVAVDGFERVRHDSRARPRDDLTRVARGASPLGPVRDEILSSWRDSIAAGLQPAHFAPPLVGDVDPQTDLVRAARPVVEQLGADLDDTDISVVLSDARALLVVRRTPGVPQRRWLDALHLAPGYLWRVDTAGTNALGLASEHRSPMLVVGNEHFMDALTVAAMATAPVTDPRSGQALGAVTLVCPAESANSLLVPFARRAADEVEHRLLDGCSARERLLDEHFLRARRRARGPLVLVGERTVLMNAAAARFLASDDQPRLWALAEQAIKLRSRHTRTFASSDGVSLAASVETVLDGAEVAGAILRLHSAIDEPEVPIVPSRRRSTEDLHAHGWASLTESERYLAELVADGLSNKQAAARLFLSRHTIDSHLRHIFRKLGINSRVDLARLVAQRDARDRSLRRAAEIQSCDGSRRIGALRMVDATG